MKSAASLILVFVLALTLCSCQKSPPTEALSPPLASTLPPKSTLQPTSTLHPTSQIPTGTHIPLTESPTKLVEPTMTDEPTPTGFDLGDNRIRPEDSMVMVYVPHGGFRMGSTNSDIDYAFIICKDYRGKASGHCERRWWNNELPAHTVILDPYWIDAYEVSNAQYRKCVQEGMCTAPSRDTTFGDGTYDNHPVVYVNWHQAFEYCDWANARLPTEAELEYATRGPDSLRFPWGDQFDGHRVNYCDMNCEYDWADELINDGYNRTSPVGSYPDGVSWCGAYDLVGNVWEWAQDWYDETYFNQSPTQNPKGPTSGLERVRRGGSWHYSSDGVRGSSRFGVGPNNADNFQGFRCASNLE